jgi:radical SAM superfamily enzyme YgiQ (UPF0313 family)
LCELIGSSEENIRFAAFAELAALYEYWKKHDHDFIGLARGGLLTVWIGIEGKGDVFGKRGGATPEDVEQMIQDLQRLGICVIGSFLVGYEGQTEEDLKEDMNWSCKFKPPLAARQIMTHSVTNLVKSRKSADSQIGLPDDEVGHTRKREHPHLTIDQINKADREWRKKFYIENGPSSLSSLLTLWEGYKSMRDSRNSNDLKTATFLYWKVKCYYHQICIMAMGLKRSIFESHPDNFIQRVVKLLKEIESSRPPDNELSKKYEEHYEKAQRGVLPQVKEIVRAGKNAFLMKAQEV